MADDGDSSDTEMQTEPDPEPDTEQDDPEAGKAGMPDDPNAPPDAGVTSSLTPQGKLDEYTSALQDVHKNNVERNQHWHDDQQKYVDYFRQRAQDLASTPPPEQQQQQMPSAPQEQKNDVAHTVMQVIAAAAIAYTVFGRSRNPYSQGAMLSGLGALLQGYQQGHAEKMKEDTANWHAHNQSVMNQNKERTEQYKQIIANKKLALPEQMQLIHMTADLHKDDVLGQKAKEKDLAGVIKNIVDKDKAQATVQGKLTKKLLPKNTGSAQWENYRMQVLNKSGGKVDVNRSQEELVQANSIYPWTDYTADQLKEAEQKHADESKSRGKVGGQSSDDPLGLGIVKPKATKTTKSVLGDGTTGGF